MEGHAQTRSSPDVSAFGVLTKSNIRAQVLELAGPALVETIFATLIGMIDMMMVGRLGPEAITAVGLTNHPLLFALALFMALNVGTTAIVAREIGAGNRKVAEHAARQSMVITSILGLIVSAFGVVFAGNVLALMGGSPEVIRMGAIYVQVVAVGVIFQVMAMNLTAVLRGAGDMKTAMRVNLIANVINVIGNYALIYGKLGMPALGLAGAAISTTASRLVSFALAARVLFKGGAGIRVRLSDNYRLDHVMLKRLLVVGVPAAMEEFVLRTGQLAFVRIVAGFGTVTFAAHQVALNILSMSFMPGQAFGMAATTLVGQGLGAKQPTFAERAAAESRKLGMYISTAVGIVFFFFGSWLMRMYTSDVQVIGIGATVLRIIAVSLPFQTTQFILRGALRGAGDTRWPLYTTAIGIWGFRVLLGYVFGILLNWRLIGVWIAMACDQVARAFVIMWRFRLGTWKASKV